MSFNAVILSMLLALSWPVSPERPPKPRVRLLETECREGYECRLVEYSSSSKERLRTYLLVPDGASRKDRRPALVLLHDHGARFDIGKEKLARSDSPGTVVLGRKEFPKVPGMVGTDVWSRRTPVLGGQGSATSKE